MRRILSSILLVVISLQASFGKVVDASTAQIVAANFCKTQGFAVSQLSLVYTASSVLKGSTVNDFYVFNNGNSGFVMVSADDRVMPVLAYSSEQSFSAVHMPDNVAYWLSHYQAQINEVIGGTVISSANATKWDALTNYHEAGARTTSAYVVGPLVKTLWNQSPYYNALCPYDATADTNAVTGCVATAMAQVMKFWNWPSKGVGTHSYYSRYGTLSAQFDTTYFLWDSMPNTISTINSSIALLMYEAGVSVNMNYGVSGSSAGVFNGEGPYNAQYALPNFFRYNANTLNEQDRGAYSDSDWINLIETEVNTGRPALYVGYGSDGGHCWVADGYLTTDNHIHFNWGWGGYCNGYYAIDNLTPGGVDLNQDQSMLMGIMPDSGTVTAVTVVPMTGKDVAVYPNPATNEITIGFGNNVVSSGSVVDMTGREISKISVNGKSAWTTVDVSKFAAGDYIVELQTAEGNITRKISVTK